MKTIKQRLMLIFYALFCICFSLITANIILNNPYHETAYLIPGTALCLAGLVLVFRYIMGLKNITEHKYRLILLIFCVCMFIIQIITGKILEFEPAFDMGAIYDGALEWAETGSFGSHYEYYYWFPNNLGAMVFLYLFFKPMSLFGVKSFFMAGVVINSIMSVCTMAVVSLICKRRSINHGLFALAIFAACLPFYIIGTTFYTDAMSMLFPVLIYYLYLRSKDEPERKRRVILYILAAAAAAIGIQIKFTVIIAVIAIIIDMLFNCEPKRTITAAVCFTVIISAVSLSVNGIIYGGHLSREKAKENNTPYTHWIMMGLHGGGLYNGDDYNFTRSFDDTKVRNAEIRKEISETIKELKYKGVFKLYLNKLTRDFGDGTYGLSDFLDEPHEKDTWLHEHVLYNGKKYSGYTHYCTSLQTALLIFCLLGAYGALTGKRENAGAEAAPYISIFGIMLFLMIWEANRRYFSNFVPMIFVCAVFSADCISKKLK